MVKAKDNIKLVPKLRFSGFRGEWESYKLGDITDKIQDGTHFSPKQYESGNFKYITSRNIRNGYMDISDVPYLSDKAHRNIYKRCNVLHNDVLLTKDGASTGNVCLNELEEEFSLLSSVAFIRANKNKATNEYIYQYICCPKGQREIRSTIAGQAITRITLTKLRNFKFHYPTLPEQEKIASFLSAVDKKIQQLTAKKQLLGQYKKGVMQKIFSQEIRFTEDNGKDYPDWQEKMLGEIGKTYGGLNGKTAIDFGEGLPFVTYKQIFDNSTIDTTKFGFVKIMEGERQNEVKYGDVLFTTSSETRLEVGVASVLLDQVEKLFLNSFCFGYRICSHDLLHPEFARYLFRCEQFRAVIVKLSQGSTRYNISKNKMMKLKLYIPVNEEQQKIASFLSSIDKKIESVQSQLNQTQTFKKGLLQQMFI